MLLKNYQDEDRTDSEDDEEKDNDGTEVNDTESNNNGIPVTIH